MRPVPRSRHDVAVAVFVAVAALYGYLAFVEYRIEDEQVHLATAALKHQHPELLREDLIYGRTHMWRVHPPMLLAILETILVPNHYRDLTLPFRALVAPLTLVYLCGMYVLLRRQCRSWSVSAFVAVLSCIVTKGLGDARWGMGALSSVTPAGICLAVTPLMVLAFLKFADTRKVLLVFVAVGALGNLHMASAVNLAIVLLIVYVVRRRFALSSWPTALGCALCAGVAAWPYAWYYLALRGLIDISSVAGFGAGAGGGNSGVSIVLYPITKLLKSMLNFILLLSVPAIVSRLVLSKVERFRVRDLDFWLPLAVAALVVALMSYGGTYVASMVADTPGPAADSLLASSLVMLPLYALLAQAITNLFRMLQAHRAMVRWGCVLLAAAWTIPSDNVRVVRHAAADAATMFMDEANKPQYVKGHREDDNEHRELVRIAARARRLPVDAMFIADEVEFRMLARRGILIAEDDIDYAYRLAPQELLRWGRWVNRQHLLLYGDQAVGPEALSKMAAELLGEKYFQSVKEWYAVLPASKKVVGMREIDPDEENQWGKCYKLYAVRTDGVGPPPTGER